MPATTIRYIERQIRNGKTPEQLGFLEVGRGVQKVAYEMPSGKFIIKENTGGFQDDSKRPPKEISKYGARAVIQFRVGKYIIQEKVTPLRNSYGKWNVDENSSAYQNWRKMCNYVVGDLHAGNCGVDSEGNLVVFDW